HCLSDEPVDKGGGRLGQRRCSLGKQIELLACPDPLVGKRLQAPLGYKIGHDRSVANHEPAPAQSHLYHPGRERKAVCHEAGWTNMTCAPEPVVEIIGPI